MEDHTVVSIVAIVAGTLIVVAEIMAGAIDPLITPIAAAAIGAGVGIPAGAAIVAKKVDP
jgi:hypothetical protein